MKEIKSFFASILVAFSTFSRIPMPAFRWDSEDMKYQLVFFPWVGAVIGGLEWGLYNIQSIYSMNRVSFVLLAIAIPLLITGGLHIDGFMDTCDALHSYRPIEKKLEILKDPHIGAFSVISLVIYLLLLLASMLQIESESYIKVACFVPFMARCLSGICIVAFKPAKKDGMLATTVSNSSKVVVIAALIIQYIAAIAILCSFVTFAVGGVVVAMAVGLIYYQVMSYRQFGGVTGDLAGYFLVIIELLSMVALAVLELIV